jgi:hypothetical protein
MASFPFYSDLHEERFLAARALARPGGEHAKICGARTRTGKVCGKVPLKGHDRCLAHAGRTAAREFRERQYQAMLRGKLPYAVFAKAEEKRAVNRLRNAWKRDPWANGRTIDLGPHEARFQEALGTPRGTPRRSRPLCWTGSAGAFVGCKSTGTMIGSGSRPCGANTKPGLTVPVPRPLAGSRWPDRNPSGLSRRQVQDRRRAVQDKEAKMPPAKSVQSLDQDDRAELSQLVTQARDVLAPLFALCLGEDEAMQVAVRFRDTVKYPENSEARRRWLEIQSALRERA